MRALVDATPLLGARTGIGEFVANLLPALAARADVAVATYSVSWRAGSVRLPARVLHELWRRIDWPRFGAKADIVHGTNFVVPPSRRPRLVTVHDLTAVRFPELVTPATRAYPDLIRRAIAAGAWVHTPSSFVAAEVVELFGADVGRVRAIHHGLAPAPAPANDSAPPYPFRYVLALGTVEPRKDLPTLVRAFDALAPSHPDLRLVVAGPDGWGVEQFDAAVAGARHKDRIVRRGYVPPEERGALLRHAAVFAFPSIYEGFGLPPLEAMAAGTPVVATRAGAVPEVVGDAAVVVAPGRPDELAEGLAEVLADEERRADLVARGRVRAAARTWNDVAADMAGLYRDVIACAS